MTLPAFVANLHAIILSNELLVCSTQETTACTDIDISSDTYTLFSISLKSSSNTLHFRLVEPLIPCNWKEECGLIMKSVTHNNGKFSSTFSRLR